jgi:starch synthase (maltosyl-transferring)
MIIYNLFPLLAGTVTHWESHTERAADMGFEWIFVNPIQKPGRSGSLYSIADYFQVNPRIVNQESILSPEQQVKAYAQTASHRGLRMMADLVINHCAVDSELTGHHPEWFIHEPDGRIAHPFCMDNGKKVVWRDLARFNHEHTHDTEGLYRFVYRIVEYLIQLGFEGFRCDAAHQVPRQFWHRLIDDVKKHYPDTVFVAETLGCTADRTKQTAQAGFDYVFNSSKWWDFQSPGSWLNTSSFVKSHLPSASPRVTIRRVCRLCRMRHSRHYAASRPMPRVLKTKCSKTRRIRGWLCTSRSTCGIVRKLGIRVL